MMQAVKVSMMGAGRQLAREGLTRMGAQVAMLSIGSCPQALSVM